jgi:hypothetical protein
MKILLDSALATAVAARADPVPSDAASDQAVRTPLALTGQRSLRVNEDGNGTIWRVAYRAER